MLMWLKCLIVGHKLVYLNESRIFAHAGDTLPTHRYKVYECEHCKKTKRMKV